MLLKNSLAFLCTISGALAAKEKFDYVAKADRLRHMLTNSIYSNKETFIRELLSNSNDALEKQRLESLTQKEDSAPLSILIDINKEKRQLIIEDNGIGMSKDELVNYLGTIAESGTSKVLEKGDNPNMIGQFGIGFYSAFIVADNVQVYSKSHADKHGHVWEGTDSSSSFTISPIPEFTSRGTRIVLHIKDGMDEFLDVESIRSLAKKYAGFFTFPIQLKKIVEVKEEKPESKAKSGDEKEEKTKEEKETKEAEPAEKKFKEEVELLNPKKPLWMRPANEIKKEEYIEFYKDYFGDSHDPLGWIHFKAEGDVMFKGLLYIPASSSVDLLKSKDPAKDIRVLARHVFVSNENYLPHSLSFVRGIIDFEDISMNVSRESFQNHRSLMTVGKTVTRKFFEMVNALEAEKLDSFLKTYTVNLKYECVGGESNRSKILKIIKFISSKDEKPVTLDEYIERNKENDSIYFIYGDSVNAIKKSPFLERYSGKEIIFAIDPIDEYLFSTIDKHEEKKIVNIAKDDTADTEVSQEIKTKFEKFLAFLKTELKSDVSEVRLNSKLSNSPFSVLASKFGWTGSFEKLIKSQSGASNNPMLSFMGFQKKILEVNPSHPFVLELLESHEKGVFGSKGSPSAKIVYDIALLKSGYDIQNIDAFVKRTQDLLSNFMKAQIKNEEIKLTIDEAELEEKKPENPFDDIMGNMPDLKDADVSEELPEEKSDKDESEKDVPKENEVSKEDKPEVSENKETKDTADEKQEKVGEKHDEL